MIRYYNSSEEEVFSEDLNPSETYTMFYSDEKVAGIILYGTPKELEAELGNALEYAVYTANKFSQLAIQYVLGNEISRIKSTDSEYKVEYIGKHIVEISKDGLTVKMLKKRFFEDINKINKLLGGAIIK